MVEYNPVISRFDPEDGASALALESLGLAEEDVEAFGASVSLMNTQAYGIAAVRPLQGKTDAVRKALQGYVDRQQSSFELYLPDQYQVAQGCPAGDPGGRALFCWSCARTQTRCLRPSGETWRTYNVQTFSEKGRGFCRALLS